MLIALYRNNKRVVYLNLPTRTPTIMLRGHLYNVSRQIYTKKCKPKLSLIHICHTKGARVHKKVYVILICFSNFMLKLKLKFIL